MNAAMIDIDTYLISELLTSLRCGDVKAIRRACLQPCLKVQLCCVKDTYEVMTCKYSQVTYTECERDSQQAKH